MNDENSQKKPDTQATPSQEKTTIEKVNKQGDDSEVKGDGLDRQVLRTIDLQKEVEKIDTDFVLGSNGRSIMDFNSMHIIAIISKTTVYFGNINQGQSKVIDLGKYFSSNNREHYLSTVNISTCFNKNYAIFFTSDNQLLVFIMKSNAEEVDLVRYPFKIKLSDKPSLYRWKDNVFYFTVGNKLQGIVFHELPNVKFDLIDSEEAGNCCNFFDLVSAKSEIVSFDCSSNDLICVSTGDIVTVYNDEPKAMFEYDLGGEGDRIMKVRNKTVDTEKGKQKNLIFSVTEKGKLFIHDFLCLQDKDKKTAKIAETDLISAFKLPVDTKLVCDDFYVSHTGRYLILIEKQFDKFLCVWWSNPDDPSTQEVQWNYFESPLNKDKSFTKTKFICYEKQSNLVFGNDIQDSTYIYFTCVYDSDLHLTVSMTPLDFISLLPEPERKPKEKKEVIMGEQQLKDLLEEKEETVEKEESEKKVSNDENILNKIQDSVYTNTTNNQEKPAKLTGFMSLADVENNLMKTASLNPKTKPEETRKSSFKEKLAQKKDIKAYTVAPKEDKEKNKEPETQPEIKPKYEKQDATANNQQTDPVNKKSKKSKKKSLDDVLGSEVFIKKLSEIFGTFHEQLTKKVNKIMDESKKTIIKDFQSSLNTSLREFKRTYGDEMATKSEKEIIPYLEKCIYKTFEKYTISLKNTYIKYTDKIESESNSAKLLTKNIESIFNAHLSTATKLERSINLFMKVLERHNKYDKQEQKEEENNVVTMLQTIAANQQLMNSAFIDMNNKISKLQVDLENLKQTQKESSQNFKKALELQKLAINTGDSRFVYDQMDSPKFTGTKSEINLPLHNESGNNPDLMKKKKSGDFIEDDISENSQRRKSVKNVFSMPFTNQFMFMNQKPPEV